MEWLTAIKNIAEKLKIEVVRTGCASWKLGKETVLLDSSTFHALTEEPTSRLLPPLEEAGRVAMIDWMDGLAAEIYGALLFHVIWFLQECTSVHRRRHSGPLFSAA